MRQESHPISTDEALSLLESHEDVRVRIEAARELLRLVEEWHPRPADLPERVRALYRSERDTRLVRTLLAVLNRLRMMANNTVAPSARHIVSHPDAEQALKQALDEFRVFRDTEGNNPFPDKYTLHELIREGGQASVFRGERVADGAAVAIKIMNVDHLASDKLRARLRDEYGLLQRIVDSHVVRVLDLFESETHLCVVMEYIQGADMDRWFRSGGQDVSLALKVVRDACLGLAVVHDACVIHRDIKPSNIMVARGGQEPVGKLVDFGLAVEYGREDEASAPKHVGTSEYVAPELLSGTTRASAQSDIYAMGVSLYCILSRGRYPVEGYLPLSSFVPGATPYIDKVLKRCLATDPSARWASAHDLALALADGFEPTIVVE